MDVSWPPRLGVGDRVRFEGRARVVSGFDRWGVQLSDPLGDLDWFTVPQLALSEDFEVLERGPRSSSALALTASEEVLERARWWERHIVEVITGLPPGTADQATPRPEFDPAVRSLREREAAKASELAAQGMSGASARTVRRRRQHYQTQGIEGLIDGRAVRNRAPGSRQDPRVLEVLMMIVADDIRRGQTSSVEAYRRSTARMMETIYGPGAVYLPSRSTFQRLVKDVGTRYGRARGVPVAGRDGIGSSRPGERVYVDTVPLGLPHHLAHLASQRVWMTVAVDELTWSVCTVMIHSSRRSLDGPLLLARLCDPPALRDTGAGSEQEATPLIMPESLLLDRKSLRRPRAFTDACRHLGIKVMAPVPGEKARGERAVGRLVSLFNVELAAHEAAGITDEATLLTWLQTRAERWVDSFWQHRPQQALRGMTGSGERPTPRAAYDACAARLGWVHLPPDRDAVRSLLPSVKRRVLLDGVYIGGRRYDCPDLAPLWTAASRTPGTPTPHLQVRFDPHDVRQVWVQSGEQRWIRVPLAEPKRRPSRRTGRATAAYRENWSPAVDLMPLSSQDLLDHDQERLAYHAQLPVLQSPLVREVLRIGERLAVMNRSAVGGHHGLLITGPPGSGKTTALQQLGRRFGHVDRFSLRGPGRSGRTPSVYLRIQPGDKTRTVLFHLAGLLRVSPLSKRASTAAVSEAVRDALISSGTSVVLVDDIFAAERPTPRGSNPVDALRYLADQVPATFVYAGLEGQESSLTAASQSAGQGRLTHLRATPLPYNADWERLVRALDQDLSLRHHQPGSLVRLAEVLHDRTGGWPTALAHLVRSAAMEAILTGNEEITEEDLDVIAV